METQAKTVLVHIPYPLLEHADIAPQLRPRRMIEAFESIGCTTIVISGSAKERKRLFSTLRKDVSLGRVTIDLVYSESAGWPNAFSEGDKLSFHPQLDVGFLRWMKNQGVPIFLFYRDAYHRTEEHLQVTFWRRILRTFLKKLAISDIKKYNSYVSLLYLPSREMVSEIPEYKGLVSALPPGAAINNKTPLAGRVVNSKRVTFLYVGGLGELYQLESFFEAIREVPQVSFVVCTRKNDWESVKAKYLPHLSPNIEIVHRSGDELEALYENATITVLPFKAHPYRRFAVPVKLFEYIGKGKPILATDGTFAGSYVRRNNLGWSLPYSADAFRMLLERLTNQSAQQEITAFATSVSNHAHYVSWEARARQVIADLSEY